MALSQQGIILDETVFSRQGAMNGVLVWSTPKGDPLMLFHLTRLYFALLFLILIYFRGAAQLGTKASKA